MIREIGVLFSKKIVEKKILKLIEINLKSPKEIEKQTL